MQSIWDAVREKTGIDKRLRLYDATRHSVASQLVNQGENLTTVSKLLGHSSIKMTEKYSHGDIEKVRASLGKLSVNKVVPVTGRSLENETKKINVKMR